MVLVSSRNSSLDFKILQVLTLFAVADRKDLATLTATTCQYFAAVLRLRPLEESVSAQTAAPT